MAPADPGAAGSGAEGRFIEHRQARALSAGAERSLARRCWVGWAAPAAALTLRARALAREAPAMPGRVHTLGQLEDESLRQMLAQRLPPAAAAALRRTFEWYACRGAGFHTDAHYGAVLFGVWCLAGPARDLVFAPCGTRAACAEGTLAVFDPFRPHAVLDPGQSRYTRPRYADAPANLFLGFEMELGAAVREAFGITAPSEGAFAISSCTAVNAESGALGH